MEQPWERPYECTRWDITTSYIGKSLVRRKPQYKATATGYRGRERWACYYGYAKIGSECGFGYTREEAEADMRRIICRDIKLYENWLQQRNFDTSTFQQGEVCPGGPQ